MSTVAAAFETDPFAPKRIEVLFDEIGELCGQRNAVDARLVEIIAENAAEGCDEQYAEMVKVATVTQLRSTLPRVEAAKFEAAHQAHREGLVADWKRDHDAADSIDPEDGEQRV